MPTDSLLDGSSDWWGSQKSAAGPNPRGRQHRVYPCSWSCIINLLVFSQTHEAVLLPVRRIEPAVMRYPLREGPTDCRACIHGEA